MHIKLYRAILITMLAFVMTSGSFLVSMAAVEGEAAPTSTPAVTEISPAEANQEKEAEPNDTEEEADETDAHGDECEHCKAEKKEEPVVEEIKPVEKTETITISTPAAHSTVTRDEPSKENEGSGDVPPTGEPEPTNGGTGTSGSEDQIDTDGEDGKEPEVVKPQESTPPAANPPAPNPSELEPDIDFDVIEKVGGHRVSYFIDIDTYVPPTCEKEGSYYLVKRCKNTGCSYIHWKSDLRTIPELGHDPGEWEVVEEATTEKEGLQVRKCTVCGVVVESTTIEKIEKPAEPVVPQPGKDPEIVKEHTPTYVTIYGSNGSPNAEVDSKGNATFKDFFDALDKNSNAEESVTLIVGGKSFTFVRHANGKVSGQLPPGFKVSGTSLIVSNVSKDLNITMTDHSFTSSISESPSGSSNGSVGLGGGAFEGPDPVANDTAVAGVTRRPANTRTNTGNASNNNAAVSITEYAESLLDSIASDNAGTESNVVDNTEETPSASSFFKADPKDNSSTDATIGQAGGNSPSKLLIAVDIALISALILGMAVLWKLGLFKFKS